MDHARHPNPSGVIFHWRNTTWRNNIGGPVAGKITFQAGHKFVIAFENSSSPGYLTEKFAQAAQSDAVPIYWGDPEVAATFNPKAFINCHDYPSLEEAAKAVAALDQDDEAYRKMISEPWFTGNNQPEYLREDVFTEFLSNIFDQPLPNAFRRNRSRWGLKYEKRQFEMAFKPHIRALKLLKEKFRKIRR